MKIRVGNRPDSVEDRFRKLFMLTSVYANGYGSCISEDANPNFYLGLQTYSCLTFHPISLFSAHCKIHCSERAVSFLLRSSALRQDAFTSRLVLDFSRDVRTFLRIRTYFALVNLMTNSEVSFPTLKKEDKLEFLSLWYLTRFKLNPSYFLT